MQNHEGFGPDAPIVIEGESSEASELVVKRRRGFAAMDAEQQRRIARMGGKTAHMLGHAHTFSSEEARRAGRKGGHRVSQDREHMEAIGRLGGLQRWRKRRTASAAEDAAR